MSVLTTLSRPFKSHALYRVINFIDRSRKEFSVPIVEVREASAASQRLTPADIEVVTPSKTLFIQVQPFLWIAKRTRARKTSPVPLAIIVCNASVSDDLLRMRIEEGLSFGYNREA